MDIAEDMNDVERDVRAANRSGFNVLLGLLVIAAIGLGVRAALTSTTLHSYVMDLGELWVMFSLIWGASSLHEEFQIRSRAIHRAVLQLNEHLIDKGK